MRLLFRLVIVVVLGGVSAKALPDNTVPTQDGPVHEAAKTCNAVQLDALLRRDPTLVNAKGEAGLTALHHAAWNGCVAVAKLLLDRGADVNAVDRNGLTPLHLAAERGQKEVALLLLERGADVNASFKGGPRPIERAMVSSQKEMMELLRQHGGQESPLTLKSRQPRPSYESRYPFHDAVQRGDLAKMKELLAEKPALLTAKDNRRRLPMHIAALSNRVDAAEILLANGADVNTKGSNHTPLLDAVDHGHLEMTEWLLRNGADVTAGDVNTTPLDHAAMKGNSEILEVLLQHYTNANLRTASAMKALVLAAVNAHTKVVERLLAFDQDPQFKQVAGNSLLRVASLDRGSDTENLLAGRRDVDVRVLASRDRGYEAIAALLLAHGADVNITGDDGTTPLLAAIPRGSTQLIHLLVSHKANVNAATTKYKRSCLDETAERMADTKEVVDLLIGSGANASAQDVDGNTALHEAVVRKNVRLVEALLAGGADVNARGAGGSTPLLCAAGWGSPPLLWSAGGGSKELVGLLVSRGADVNATDDQFKFTPLHMLAQGLGDKSTAELLIDKGANVNARDVDGHTPLHLTARLGNQDVAEVLLARGAEVNARGHDGLTPLSLALASELPNPDLVRLLRRRGGIQ